MAHMISYNNFEGDYGNGKINLEYKFTYFNLILPGTEYYIMKFIKYIDIEFSNALCNIQICAGIVVY